MNNVWVLLHLAREGLGVARMPHFLCREHLASGALQTVLPEWQPVGYPVHVLLPSRRYPSPAVRALLALIEKHQARPLRRGSRRKPGRRPGSWSPVGRLATVPPAIANGAGMKIEHPYLLFLGDAPDQLAAKTAQRHRGLAPGLVPRPAAPAGLQGRSRLPDMTVAEAAAKGARTMIVGVANRGGVLRPTWVAH